jgi:Relaxase/Mobilisation nuclease domain
MIGKQVKGTSFRGVLNYLHHKEGAERIGGNMIGQEPRSLAAEFRVSRSLNRRLKKAVYHASLSLPKTESLNAVQWMAIAQDYLNGMGFEGCQYVVYRHSDQDHDHIHIVASRIRLVDGKTVSDSWDYRRSEELIRKLEQEYQLQSVIPSWEQDQRAPTTGERRYAERTGAVSVRETLQTILNQVSCDRSTMPQLIDRLQQRNISVKVVQTRKGIRGISYEGNGVAFSGTKLGRAYTFPGLQKHRGVDYEPDRDDAVIRQLIEQGSSSEQQREGQERDRPNSLLIKECIPPTEPVPSKKDRYQQMWQRYSQGISANTPVKLDRAVARKAFEDEQSPKDIGLMLAAGSPYVAQIQQQQGSDKAKAYVSQTARVACRSLQQELKVQRQRTDQLEL